MGSVACDACAKRFQVELVSNVFYLQAAVAMRARWPVAAAADSRGRRERGSARFRLPGRSSARLPRPPVRGGHGRRRPCLARVGV